MLAGIIGGIVLGPNTALYAAAAERISTTRMATAFAAFTIMTSLITQTWTFLVPILVNAFTWNWTMVIAGCCSISATIFYLQAKGPLFGQEKKITTLEEAEEAERAEKGVRAADKAPAVIGSWSFSSTRCSVSACWPGASPAR